MKQFRLLTLLALLLTAATGAWAQDAKHLITATYREQTRSLEQPLPYATSIGELYEAVSGQSFSDLISSMSSVGMPLTGITSRNTSIVSIGEFNGASTPVTVIADGETIINLIFGNYVQAIFVSATSPLYAYMKDGVKDADKWTVKVGEGQAQALPIGGLKGDGKETVTLQYNGRLKVKGVKATSEAAEATPALSITSPSVGQVIGSDGKNYAYGSLPEGVTKVAMIAYVSGSNGLAIALADEGSMNWATAKSTCEGKSAIGGNSWKLPTQAEWKQMFSANGGNEGNYSGLNSAITTAGGTVLQESGDYWSSTPIDGSYAWDVFLSGGAAYWYDDTYVSDDLRVRACLAFTVEQAAKPAATVTTAPTGAAIVGVGKTTALVSGGAAEGGTMMYKVTDENTKPASTDGFSDAVPTAQSITASGKVYVWYYVKGDDTHSDSEIAATAIEVPVADIIWDATNVSDLRVQGTFRSDTKEGVTLSANADMNDARWRDKGDEKGIFFEAMETGGYTFTAPTGKKFTKIEMTLNEPMGWDIANLGTGWTFNNATVTWTGSAASTVGLLTDAGNFNGTPVISIAFYLSK